MSARFTPCEVILNDDFFLLRIDCVGFRLEFRAVALGHFKTAFRMTPSVVGVGSIVHLARAENKPFENVGIGKTKIGWIDICICHISVQCSFYKDCAYRIFGYAETHLAEQRVLQREDCVVFIHNACSVVKFGDCLRYPSKCSRLQLQEDG